MLRYFEAGSWLTNSCETHDRFSIAPDKHIVGSLCKDPEVIREGIAEGYESAMSSLTGHIGWPACHHECMSVRARA